MKNINERKTSPRIAHERIRLDDTFQTTQTDHG